MDSPWIIAHKKVHQAQRARVGRLLWIAKYLLQKEFRLSQEAEAIAMEIVTSPKELHREIMDRYCDLLTKQGVVDIPYEAQRVIYDEICKLVD